MPFSWKKTNRGNRFSKLVADHLQSPKRGGSLVVETGFPTSLIDLYVRNRGRFRKSSKKQREFDSPTPLSPCSSSRSSGLLVESHNITSASSSSSLVDLNNLSSGGLNHRETDEIIEEDVVVGVSLVAIEDEIKDSTETEEELIVEMAKPNPVLVLALKVLVLVILVPLTKRFTIGITISAFVLLFFESVVKQLFARSSFLRPRTDSKTLSESSFKEIKNIKSLEENTTLAGNKVLEIEEQVDSNQEVRSEKELDELRSEVLMEIRHKGSRRAIMKSRMKKLVPKKLLRSSMSSKEEISYGFIEEETLKSNQVHKTLAFSGECSDSKGETLRILKQNQDKIVELEEKSLSSSSSSSMSSEIDCNDKEIGRKLHQNSGCLVLCLIVLVGLIGGRVMAVVLALSWCLMLKKLQWRNVKFPIS